MADTSKRRTRPRQRIDVKSVIKHLGGVAVLKRKLSLLDFDNPPTEHQMRQWVRRGRIDSGWLLVLLQQAKAEGRPIDLTEYAIET